MKTAVPSAIRAARQADPAQWRPRWDGCNAFYGRQGDTALPEAIAAATWQRFFDPAEPVHALVAEQCTQLVALVRHLFHRSTTRLHDVCCLQDLFTAPGHRGRGIGRQPIDAA
jgi:GNAT superfamily N-acetyltransferase